MKKKKWGITLLIFLIAAVLAVSCELALDRFVDGRTVETERERAVYQLFPNEDTQYIDCVYEDGLLVSLGEDPQMVWSVSHDKPLSDLMVRFSAPIDNDCEIQAYYDDTGAGFTGEKVLLVTAQAYATEAYIPLVRGNYYALRVDINGTVPLSQIDCASSVILIEDKPGDFQMKRCLLILMALAALMLLLYNYHNDNRWHRAIRAYVYFLRSDVLWAFLVSVGISVYFSLYYHLRDIHEWDEGLHQMLHPFWPVLVVVFLVLYGSIRVSRKEGFSLGDWLYKNRWAIGLCLMVLCVTFNLNISSLHEWAAYLGSQDKDGVLVGMSRGIRSDEWVKAIAVLKALGYEHYPVFSNLIRATSTENVLIAGQVAWDISALFRPFSWGFLIFNSTSYGLSFNNFGMIIAFFLLSFDFFMLISQNRRLSFAFACMLLFSPFVQWWTCFSLIISSFALLLAAHRYLTTESIKIKLLSAVCVIVFAGNFVLSMYPAWQVPLAYFLLAGLIWIIYTYRSQIKLRLKVDLPIIGGALLFLVACGLFIFLRSAPAIHDMLNTVYPGAVRSNAPQSIDKLYVTYLNMFSQYTAQYVPGANLSEAADFLTFFPVGILLCIYAMIRNKKVDVFSVLMILLSAFFAVFTFMDTSETLRKITLMSFSMSQRILPWFGFIQIILLFRGVSLLKTNVKWFIAVPVSALFAWFIVHKISATSVAHGQDLILAGIGAVLFLVIWTALQAGKGRYAMRTFATVMVFFSLFSAGMVHPIQSGMAEIEESGIVIKIHEITEQDPEGKWLVDNLSYPFGMTPLLGGAPTINCVNNYPNLDMWYLLDPERDDEYAYNRYVSQIIATLVQDEDTSCCVGWVDDVMELRLNIRDMHLMNIGYVLTNRALESFSTDTVKFTRVGDEGMFIIYQINYSGDSE